MVWRRRLLGRGFQTNEDSHEVVHMALMDQSGSHSEASSGWARRPHGGATHGEDVAGQAMNKRAAPAGESWTATGKEQN